MKELTDKASVCISKMDDINTQRPTWTKNISIFSKLLLKLFMTTFMTFLSELNYGLMIGFIFVEGTFTF